MWNRFPWAATKPRNTSRLPPPPQTSLPLQFSAVVAKYTLHDDTESDEGDEGEESDTNTSDNGSDSGDNDDQVYTWPPKASSFELVTWYGLPLISSGKWSR